MDYTLIYVHVFHACQTPVHIAVTNAWFTFFSIYFFYKLCIFESLFSISASKTIIKITNSFRKPNKWRGFIPPWKGVRSNTKTLVRQNLVLSNLPEIE